MPDDDKPDSPPLDPKVKALLERDQGKSLKEIVDEQTAEQLQRWFGLPSFEQLAETEPPPELSPEDAADQAKRDETLATVRDWMMAGLDYRHHRAWDLIQFQPTIDVLIDVDMPMFEASGLDRIHANSEVRELSRPADIEDELKDHTPQALLRDLHRSVSSFDIQYEVPEEVAAEVVVDAVVEVRQAMATNWKLPDLGDPPHIALRKIMAEFRQDIIAPWADLPSRVEMPNRRVID